MPADIYGCRPLKTQSDLQLTSQSMKMLSPGFWHILLFTKKVISILLSVLSLPKKLFLTNVMQIMAKRGVDPVVDQNLIPFTSESNASQQKSEKSLFDVFKCNFITKLFWKNLSPRPIKIDHFFLNPSCCQCTENFPHNKTCVQSQNNM